MQSCDSRRRLFEAENDVKMTDIEVWTWVGLNLIKNIQKRKRFYNGWASTSVSIPTLYSWEALPRKSTSDADRVPSWAQNFNIVKSTSWKAPFRCSQRPHLRWRLSKIKSNIMKINIKIKQSPNPRSQHLNTQSTLTPNHEPKISSEERRNVKEVNGTLENGVGGSFRARNARFMLYCTGKK